MNTYIIKFWNRKTGELFLVMEMNRKRFTARDYRYIVLALFDEAARGGCDSESLVAHVYNDDEGCPEGAELRRKHDMKKLTIYRNKRNENKYIEVVRYGCGHYYAVQFMQWGQVVNKLGSRTGRRFRFCKGTLDGILEDYTKAA